MRRLCLLLALVSAAAAAEPFPYDQQLAVELSVAYVRSHFRQRLEHAVPDLTFEKPVVVSAIDNRNRRLVVVTFASATGGGAYVVLEEWSENGLLVAAQSGAVDNIERYRRDMGSITPKTFVAVPSVCPVAE